MRTLGVLLAAGSSHRFGPDDKLLAVYGKQPLVTAAAQTLLSAGCDTCIAIVSSPKVAAVLPGEMAPIFLQPGLPMAVSFHRAVEHARHLAADKLLIYLGDTPNIPPRHLRMLVAQDRSSCSALGPVRMPPATIMACDYGSAAEKAQGDRGARDLLSIISPDATFELTEFEALDIDYTHDIDRARAEAHRSFYQHRSGSNSDAD